MPECFVNEDAGRNRGVQGSDLPKHGKPDKELATVLLQGSAKISDFNLRISGICRLLARLKANVQILDPSTKGQRKVLGRMSGICQANLIQPC